MLNNLINRAAYKIFKVSDKDVICNIRQYLGLHDVDVLCKETHERFLSRTGLLRHAVLRSLIVQYNFIYFDLLFVVFLGLDSLYIEFYVFGLL